jgi:hypothetical protein
MGRVLRTPSTSSGRIRNTKSFAGQGKIMGRVGLLVLIGLFLGGDPVAGQAHWLKGNVHVHTNLSDGASPPAEVIEWYRTHGYAFLFVTDHNLQTVTPDLKARFDTAGEFLLLPGAEVTDRVGSQPVHLNALGVLEAPVPSGGSDVPTAIRGNLQAIRSAGGVAVLNHPNGLLSRALTAADISEGGVSLFEVCCADFMGGSGHPSTDRIWDEVLTTGRILYGVAADDAHDFGRESHDPGSAWIMVRASELTGPAILDALRQGDFYATTGVQLRDVRATSEGLCVLLDEYEVYGYRTEFIGPRGEVLEVDESEGPCFEPGPGDGYVRARVQRSDGALAWVQPVWLSGG